MGTRQECAPRSRNCQADERNIAARLSWRVSSVLPSFSLVCLRPNVRATSLCLTLEPRNTGWVWHTEPACATATLHLLYTVRRKHCIFFILIYIITETAVHKMKKRDHHLRFIAHAHVHAHACACARLLPQHHAHVYTPGYRLVQKYAAVYIQGCQPATRIIIAHALYPIGGSASKNHRPHE